MSSEADDEVIIVSLNYLGVITVKSIKVWRIVLLIKTIKAAVKKSLLGFEG